MGKDEIFAYRIGEGLFCPKCYEEAEKNLPKDSGIKMMGKPIKKEDLSLYICLQCKAIKHFSGKGFKIGRIDEKNHEFKHNELGEVIKMRRRATFIERRLRAAKEGRPLIRRDVLVLFNFFGSIRATLDNARAIITNSILDDIFNRPIIEE